MTRGRQIVWIALVLSSAGGLFSRQALAVPIGARELRARQDFAAGRYDEALEIFAELYAKTADPIFLRNIARCYQKENRTSEAIATFREYLTKAKKLAPGERDEIEGYIHQMDANRPAEKPPANAAAPAAAPPPPPERPSPPPPTERPAPPPHPPVATPSPSEPVPANPPVAATGGTGREEPITTHAGGVEPRRDRSVSVPGLVFTIAGAALVGTGVAFGLAARSAAKSVAAQYDPDRDSAGHRDAILQWVGYGVGAAALVTGVILLVRGPSEADNAPSVRVGLSPGGALVAGTF